MNKNPHVMNKSRGYQIVDKVWVLYRCPELVMDQWTQCRNVMSMFNTISKWSLVL